MCEQRGVAWSEVDLRWGVTDEQKAEGAVLPICLAEIDRSRPYFLGLLGQRYGWGLCCVDAAEPALLLQPTSPFRAAAPPLSPLDQHLSAYDA
jgi:hypothetical protein